MPSTFGGLDLETRYNQLMGSNVSHVSGVYPFYSGKDGPTVGILVQTHGNEPVGLATFAHFFKYLRTEGTMKTGQVFIILVNPSATEKYLRAETDDHIRAARFVDLDMNRLPEKVMGRRGDMRSEVQRAQRLQKVLDILDFTIDVHTTTQKGTDAMIVFPGEINLSLIVGFPIDKIISNIGNVTRGTPILKFCKSDKENRGVAIEAGSHQEVHVVDVAIRCVTAFLENVDVLDVTTLAEKREYEHYKVVSSIRPEDETWRMARVFTNFERVKHGEPLATFQGGLEIRAHAGHTLFCRGQTHNLQQGVEQLFLSDPVRELVL